MWAELRATESAMGRTIGGAHLRLSAQGIGPSAVQSSGPGALGVGCPCGQPVRERLVPAQPPCPGHEQACKERVAAADRYALASPTGSDELLGLHLRGTSVTSRITYATVQQPNTVDVDDTTGELVVTGSTQPGALQLLP